MATATKETLKVQPLADRVLVQPLEVKAGDTVLYGRYSGTELKIEGDDYIILKEEDILAILK